MNKVILLGNLTQSPELKYTPQGLSVCSFPIATNKSFLKDGQKVQKVEYHNIVAFSKKAEAINSFFHKGSKILIEGELTTRNWQDKDHNHIKHYRTEINLISFEFCEGKKEQHQPQNTSYEIPSTDFDPENLPF